MNVDTGELFNILNDEQLDELKDRFGDAIQPVPEEHIQEAKKELGNNNYVKVDMTRNTKLINWAKKKRKKKSAKKSRKANRK